MTTPTDDPKVKALIEAARDLTETCPEHIPGGRYNKIYPALAAFDPPKPKQYPPMPEWEEFTVGKKLESTKSDGLRVFFGDEDQWTTTQKFYVALRQATAKD